jgi:hypothetical protein
VPRPILSAAPTRADSELLPVIPLPIILVEFLLAFGAALFIAQVVAVVQLRRHGNWPPTRPVGALDASDGEPAAVPSRPRILTLLAIGLGVSLWSLATLVARAAL